MYTINMLSKAHTVKGQGVLSAHDEQVALVKAQLGKDCTIYENKKKICTINHYHTINLGFYFHSLFTGKKGSKVGYVHFLPETLEESIRLPRWMKKIFYRYLIHFYKRMDQLVIVNPYFIEKLEAYGIDRGKITYIPNVVSEETFYPADEKKKKRFRKDLEIEDKFTVLCVGQLQKRKGVLDMLKLAELMPEMNFLWAGNFAFGTLSNGYDEIKKAAQKPPHNVKFLGLVDRKDMNRLYNAADILFQPSYEELFPMAILEAMSCELPVLVRELPIYERILGDYVLKGSGNEEFYEKMNRLHREKSYFDAAADLSKQGKQRYSREQVARLWVQFYRSMLEKERSPKLHAIPDKSMS